MAQGAKRRVWGIGSPRTFRVHWVLAELGLDYETKPILTRSPEMKSREFRARSEREKIPLYEDDDLVIGESAAIALHLADRHRDRVKLVPEAASLERVRHDELCFFIMTEMDALLYVLRRHEGLPEIYGASEVACDAARDYFLRSLGEMERRLCDARSHLLGSEFSVADILLKSCLDWASFVGIEIPEFFDDYSQRLAQRPAYATAMAINFTPAALAALTPSNV
jgi:glutathione S-transferase